MLQLSTVHQIPAHVKYIIAIIGFIFSWPVLSIFNVLHGFARAMRCMWKLRVRLLAARQHADVVEVPRMFTQSSAFNWSDVTRSECRSSQLTGYTFQWDGQFLLSFKIVALDDGTRALAFLLLDPYAPVLGQFCSGASVGECFINPLTGCLHFSGVFTPELVTSSPYSLEFCLVAARHFALRYRHWAETGRFEVPQDWPGSPAMLAHLTATEAK